MKTRLILMAELAVLAVFSCSKNDVIPEGDQIPPAKVVSITHDDSYGMTVCAIEYPSVDPEGKPVTLSAVITYGDEISEKSPARGIMLVNRITAYGLADTPSGGELVCQEAMVGSGLVCVSPDLYGYGPTKDKMQAYCMGNTNAQATIDALLAAQELIREMEIPFEPGKKNRIFNLGYSQGAQTSLGVLRLAAEKYPDIHFTHTFAGSGPYDMLGTFNFMISADVPQFPAPVILAIIAFNEYYHLGYTMADLFQPSAIPVIEQYLLSKEYTSNQVTARIPIQRLENYVKEDVLNPDTEISRRLSEALAKENFFSGWVPRKEERIFLFSNPQDEVVAPLNTQNLYQFLVEEQEMPHVEWLSTTGITPLVPDFLMRHVAAAADFALQCVSILTKNYNIVWMPNFTQIIEDKLAKMGKE